MGLTMPRDSGKLAMHQPKKMEERRDGIVGGGRPPVISAPFLLPDSSLAAACRNGAPKGVYSSKATSTLSSAQTS